MQWSNKGCQTLLLIGDVIILGYKLKKYISKPLLIVDISFPENWPVKILVYSQTLRGIVGRRVI